MTNKLPNDFIISNEYCVIEPGLTTFNKDQIITHADLMKHLEKHDINTISVLPHMSDDSMTYDKLQTFNAQTIFICRPIYALNIFNFFIFNFER